MIDISSVKVSIITPVYNGSKFIEDTLLSVINQTHSNWELIVVNDGSTDGTDEILRKYEEENKKIVILENKINLGVAKTRQIGLKKATGEMVAFLDADDLWDRDKLSHQLLYMKQNKIAMCFTAYETINESGQHIRNNYVPTSIDYEGFLKNTVTCSHSLMIDTGIISLGKLIFERNVQYDYPDDLDLWLHVLKNGYKAHGLNEILVSYRKHKGSRSSDLFRNVIKTWNQYHKNEKLNVVQSLYFLTHQVCRAIMKRI